VTIIKLDTGGAGQGGENGEASEKAELDGLRLRAADALERAHGFVCAHGDPLAKLRAEVHLEARTPAELARALAERMAPDGSFAPLGLIAGGALGLEAVDDLVGTGRVEAGVVGALEALLLAGEAKQLHAGWVEPCVGYVAKAQAPDGGFGEALAGDPPDDARLVLTGMLAGILARTKVVRPELLDGVSHYLGARWAPEQVEGGRYDVLMAFAHYFTNAYHDLGDEALQWCGRELERGFRTRRFDALATLRVMLTCDAEALPGATFDGVELADRLLGEQAGDGGFAELSAGSVESRVTPTVDAILALVRLCQAF